MSTHKYITHTSVLRIVIVMLVMLGFTASYYTTSGDNDLSKIELHGEADDLDDNESDPDDEVLEDDYSIVRPMLMNSRLSSIAGLSYGGEFHTLSGPRILIPGPPPDMRFSS